jgi:DNA gyrase/topoisomerase IV subunit B
MLFWLYDSYKFWDQKSIRLSKTFIIDIITHNYFHKMEPHVDQYRYMSAIEHIFHYPELYIGNMTLNNGISEGLRRVLLEGLCNCVEASAKVSNPYIEILIEGNIISFKNKGMIPLAYDDVYYIPEKIFGTYSHYRNYAHNGLGGVRATNICSKLFHIEIGNAVEHQHYDQLWQNNSQIKHDPIITDYHGIDFVKISFELDFERFGCTGLTSEMINILGDYCKTIDASIPVLGYFENELIKEPDTK